MASSCMVGSKNNLAQMVIMTRRYVANKNHVPRSKIKVTVRTSTLFIGFSETCSYPSHKFVVHSGIYKLFNTNNDHDKTICRE